MNDVAHHVIDIAAVSWLVGVLMGALPHATALLTFIWVVIRLLETATVRAALRRLRQWRSD
jgi:hypothetical protein